MNTAATHDSVPMEDRIRRASGRHARKISATAKLTREEHCELEAEAKRTGKALGEWCRETLLGAARGQALTPEFTEVVAMRVLLNTVLSKLACGETMTREAFNKEMHSIRTNKRKAAEEVMQQYTKKEASR